MVVVAALVLVGVGIGAYAAGRSSKAPGAADSSRHQSHSTVGSASPTTIATSPSTTLPPSTTAVPPVSTTTAPAPIPQVADCGGAPGVRPTSLYWCSSACSSYMTGISWTTWGPDSATGTGTWVTKTDTPRTGQSFVPCSTSTPVPHPGTPIVLSTPQDLALCPSGGGQVTDLVFTHANVSVGVTATSNSCRQ